MLACMQQLISTIADMEIDKEIGLCKHLMELNIFPRMIYSRNGSNSFRLSRIGGYRSF